MNTQAKTLLALTGCTNRRFYNDEKLCCLNVMVTEVVASEFTANCEIRKAKRFKPTADIHTFPLEKLRRTGEKKNSRDS